MYILTQVLVLFRLTAYQTNLAGLIFVSLITEVTINLYRFLTEIVSIKCVNSEKIRRDVLFQIVNVALQGDESCSFEDKSLLIIKNKI